MAEQKEIRRLEPERNPDLFHFVHEARKFPQLRDIRLVGVVGAELIVVIELDPGLGEVGVAGLEVLVRAAWAAVQQQQLDVGIVAEAPGPHPERAVRRRHRYAAYAAGKAVVARGVVEVCRHRPSSGGIIVAVGQGIPPAALRSLSQNAYVAPARKSNWKNEEPRTRTWQRAPL